MSAGSPDTVKHVQADHIVCHAKSSPPLPLGVIPSITKNTTVPLDHRAQSTHGSLTTKFYYYIQNVYTTVRMPNAPLMHGYQMTAEYAQVSSRPGISIEYAVSGFAAQCLRSYASPSHFLVHLCAVAGGVYTVASFLEAGVEILEKQRKRQQRSVANAQNTAAALAQNVAS
ncbi:hypothetical protein STCU_04862 [Strigomonas culicis]|nr:hypothetical protein STCU_04862 [Strigomonas culicis]|eukprot:EPY28825.1 hypothetical protein STCU_04862 [Strigomonas culicis]